MIAKEFNPSITKSYYITRHLLLNAIKKYANELSCYEIMDFGCGSSPYRELIECNRYVRVDYYGEGHSHDNEEQFIEFDGKKLIFSGNRFDSIICTEVMEHVFELPTVLKELFRVLRPNGTMLITLPYTVAQHEIPNHFANYTEYGICYLLRQAGFTIIFYDKLGTSVEAQFQMFMSYLDSYVICKFKKLGLYKSVAAITFTMLNLCCMFFNWLLPKKYDSFLNHIIICKKY